MSTWGNQELLITLGSILFLINDMVSTQNRFRSQSRDRPSNQTLRGPGAPQHRNHSVVTDDTKRTALVRSQEIPICTPYVFHWCLGRRSHFIIQGQTSRGFYHRQCPKWVDGIVQKNSPKKGSLDEAVAIETSTRTLLFIVNSFRSSVYLKLALLKRTC